MNLSFECSCGQVKGIVKGASTSHGPRIICYCDDCQAAAYWLGRARDLLDESGGTEITPLFPNTVTITEGQSLVKGFRLSEKGLYRWYASCCNSLLGNNPGNPKVAYIGFATKRFKAPKDGLEPVIGPVAGGVEGRYGIPPLPAGTHQKVGLGLIFPYIAFLMKGMVLKKAQPHPFFSAQGLPKTQPYVLTVSERQALQVYCGPQPSTPAR